MKYRLKIDYLNINNIPRIEKLLEDMARQGWLLKKIISGSFFIYEKIGPRELDFSISPYEIETSLNRKSREELEEYREACRQVGWNYIATSFDLHIYYKDKGREAWDIHTDTSVEFSELEKLLKKQVRPLYILLPILIFLTYSRFIGAFNNSHYMRSGLLQAPTLILPFIVITGLIEVFNLRKFLKVNRKNIELGDPLEYNKSKDSFTRFFFKLFYLSLVFLIGYLIYSSIVLKNKVIVISFLIPLVGLLLGSIYRHTVKDKKIPKGWKIGLLFLSLILAGLGGTSLLILATKTKTTNLEEVGDKNISLVTLEDFQREQGKGEKVLLRDSSFLVPRSYTYFETAGEDRLDIEYSEALNEALGERLVEVYIKEQKDIRSRRTHRALENLYNTKNPSKSLLEEVNLTEEEYLNFKSDDIDTSIDRALEYLSDKDIKPLDKRLWGADQAYSLDIYSEKILLRRGRKVYLLEGLDFTREENRLIIVDKLMDWED